MKEWTNDSINETNKLMNKLIKLVNQREQKSTNEQNSKETNEWTNDHDGINEWRDKRINTGTNKLMKE